MINIIVDYKECEIKMEDIHYSFNREDMRDIEYFFLEMLKKIYFSGETINLEVRDKKGFYKELDRFS